MTPPTPQAASTPDEVPAPDVPDMPKTEPSIPVEPDPVTPDPGPDETPDPGPDETPEPDQPLGPVETPAPEVGDAWDSPARADRNGDGIADADEVEQPESRGGTGEAMLSEF